MWKGGHLGIAEAVLCNTYWPGHSSALGEEWKSSPCCCSLKGSGFADDKDFYLSR